MLLFLFFGTIVILGAKASVDFNDPDNQKLSVLFGVLAGIMVFSTVVGLIRSTRVAVNGKNLILPFEEDTKEAVGRFIDQEVAEGKILVEEYIDEFSEGKEPYGAKVVLLPTYLLLCLERGKVIAIPRDKIYWLCAQVGRKGASSFIVRLLVFTEKGTFDLDGADVDHVKQLADKIYQYIPNVFSEYDPFILSYELEKLFKQNREGFLEFYKDEVDKKK